MAINDSLGLGDADLIDQLAAIQKKNELVRIFTIRKTKSN